MDDSSRMEAGTRPNRSKERQQKGRDESNELKDEARSVSYRKYRVVSRKCQRDFTHEMRSLILRSYRRGRLPVIGLITPVDLLIWWLKGPLVRFPIRSDCCSWADWG
jgi:hypothetical protein